MLQFQALNPNIRGSLCHWSPRCTSALTIPRCFRLQSLSLHCTRAPQQLLRRAQLKLNAWFFPWTKISSPCLPVFPSFSKWHHSSPLTWAHNKEVTLTSSFLHYDIRPLVSFVFSTSNILSQACVLWLLPLTQGRSKFSYFCDCTLATAPKQSPPCNSSPWCRQRKWMESHCRSWDSAPGKALPLK